jgi:diguanylate cyclase
MPIKALDNIGSCDAPERGAATYQYMAPKHVYTIAFKALDIMHVRSIPPDPIAYWVWFAYEAKSNHELVRAIDLQLKSTGNLSKHEIVQLYETYIQDSHAEAIRQNLGLDLEYSLKSVSDLVSGSVNRSRGFSEQLKNTAVKLDSVKDSNGLKAIVSEVQSQNSEMASAVEAFSHELIASQTHIAKLNRKLEQLQALSLLDPLTGVSNRRAFDVRLKQDVEESFQANKPLCLTFIDLDHFKRINDLLGHQIGDKVLKGFANFLRAHTSDKTLIARYGGEEFAVILNDTKIIDAHNQMISLARKLEKMQLLSTAEHERIGAITASFGIANYRSGRSDSDIIRLADKQLYAAKTAGRNRVHSEGL